LLLKQLSGGVARISDFGLSIGYSLYTKGRAVDNPLWLAVEVMKGQEYSEKADVYSFGIILWELLTSLEPFSETPLTFFYDLEAKIINGLRPLIPPDCPAGWAKLMRQCWKETPDARPAFPVVLDVLLRMQEELKENTFLTASDASQGYGSWSIDSLPTRVKRPWQIGAKGNSPGGWFTPSVDRNRLSLMPSETSLNRGTQKKKKTKSSKYLGN